MWIGCTENDVKSGFTVGREDGAIGIKREEETDSRKSIESLKVY